ncbi:MAG: tRNA (guanosine(37)-N1)-methyltransferase TrmD [Bdellovibrionales bacterium]|nr:tRNA (guanosine(37)-N1)-methyltransferase TrmD [Bdellovibrionales bacterium]
MLKVNIVTLFPDFFSSPLKMGILGRAIQSKLLKIHFVNPRDFTADVHQSVDDTPFGGGDGMVMMYHPLKKAIESLPAASQKVIYLSPQGQQWNHVKARTWAEQADKEWTFICGRYAGVDQRFINKYVDEEISIGDYVLTGGEPAMLVLLDSLSRFIRGALGNKSSSINESFEQNHLLEAPQWTRPRDIPGYEIPKVMLSGHHKDIKNFQYLISILITAVKRPDMLIAGKIQQDLPKAIKMVESLSEKELKACGLNMEHLQTLKKRMGMNTSSD